MLFDEGFWVSISIIIFIFLVFRHVKSPLKHSLAKRASDISAKITEAERLRKESIELLNEFKLLYKNAQNEIEIYAKQLDQEIESIGKKSEQDLKEKLEIRSKNIAIKIKNMEEKTLSEIRLEAIKLAITAGVHLLREKSSKESNFAFIEKALHSMNLSNI